jgi:ribosomal protein S8
MKNLIFCLQHIQSAINGKKDFVFIKKNRNLFFFLDLLVREGFILSYVTTSFYIKVFLKYDQIGLSPISKIRFISTVSRILKIKRYQQQYSSTNSVYVVGTPMGYRLYKTKKNLIIEHNSGSLICSIQ